MRDRLVKIGAKTVCHSSYLSFQETEIAVQKILFADVLCYID